ncbi:MAG: HIT family protein [Rhodobacterales bacterium]|jgi:ATP adenylyltransferase
MLHEQRQSILDQDNTVTGFNIGINAGASAGQTVFHVHVHLIPRRDGDVVDPRGGVRAVIPSKQKY